MKRTECAKRMERSLTAYHNNDNIMIEKGGALMPKIKPISDLRNNFTEISRIVHEGNEPVFLTKNGYGDMVVMSVEQYEAFRAEKRIDSALLEAQQQAGTDSARFDFDDVSVKLRKKLADKVSKSDA
jgi:prevent-host-death family protein